MMANTSFVTRFLDCNPSLNKSSQHKHLFILINLFFFMMVVELIMLLMVVAMMMLMLTHDYTKVVIQLIW